MTIHFIGAGPGAADLMTVRGRDLLGRCLVCLYAGSMIPPEVLNYCPADARLIDTAPMTLDEIEAECVAAHAAGEDVARLHSGDLSVFSAVAEQIRRLKRRDIPYTLTPGVPAFAAAAALLGRELTVPEIAQSVVLTRVPGRASQMPAAERLRAFAATGATLVVHLAIQAIHKIVGELIPVCGEDCPVAVVARATWPDERIVRGTLGNIGAKLATERIERTAIILIGHALAADDFRESALYDPAYHHRFRGEEANDRRAAIPTRPDAPVLAPGHVWLAGAGPGDPGLLTLDALAGLSQADVVVHDALVDRRVLALANPRARLEFAGKRGGRPSADQNDISIRLIALARAGHRVLRLKGGDPCVFGRGGEEALALIAAGVPFRIIPGVTAGLAGLTAAAIPATFRGMNRALILAAGYGADDEALDWTALARTGQPIVLYMAMRNLANIADQLMRGGLPPSTPAAVVAGATTADERVVVSTLDRVGADAQQHQLSTPSIIVIGNIVKLRERLLDGVHVAQSEAAS
jgi:precorrin-4/cobalt-precorrin-4 C11-methyltransferase